MIQLGVYLAVKFRIFGITLGSFAKSLALSIDPVSKKLAFGEIV